MTLKDAEERRYWFPVRKDETAVGFLGLHMWGLKKRKVSTVNLRLSL